jgi:hypothetical protein
MKIDNQNLNGASALHPGRTQETNPAQTLGSASSSRGAGPASGDHAKVSSLAESISQALASHSVNRAQRVQELAKQYSAGSYRPDVWSISRSLIESQLEATMACNERAVQPATGPASLMDPASTLRLLQQMVHDAGMQLTAPTPEKLDDCRRRLDVAVELFRQMQTNLPSGNYYRDSALRAQLGELRAEIARLTILLDGAAAFHTGWVRLAASMVAGYTADGTPGQPEPARRVWLEV